MAEFVAEVPIPGAGTFFCTQRYAALDPASHELCAHPTLEPGGDWGAALDASRTEFPDARGIRAHSCVESHMLSIDLGRRGIEWISAREEAGRPEVAPYKEAWGVWHVPIYYMDNMDFSFGDFWPQSDHTPFERGLLESAVQGEGVYVFDFHPIHLLLNSNSAEAYLARRGRFIAGEPIEALRFDGYGARDYYDELLKLMAAAEVKSVRISDAVAAASREGAPPGSR